MMKQYYGYRELYAVADPEIKRSFVAGRPIVATVSGVRFKKFAQGLKKPYDSRIAHAMFEAANFLLKQTRASTAFIHLDQITLVWSNDRQSDVPFGGKVQKLTSLLASRATGAFLRAVLCSEDEQFNSYAAKLPGFVAHAYQVSTLEEAVTALHLMECRARRRSRDIVAKEFGIVPQQGDTIGDILDDIRNQGKEPERYPSSFVRGTYMRLITTERPWAPGERERRPEEHRPAPDSMCVVQEAVVTPLPRLTRLSNAVEVVFGGATPIVMASEESELA